MKKIKCSGCPKVFAHLLDEGTVEFSRQSGKHRVLIIGGNYTMMGTCGYCSASTSLRVVDGKLDEENVKFKEIKPDDQQPEEPKPADASGEPAASGHDQGQSGEPEQEPGSGEGGTGEPTDPSQPTDASGGIPADEPIKPERRHTTIR